MAGGATSIFYTEGIRQMGLGVINMNFETSLVMALIKDAPNGNPDDPDLKTVTAVLTAASVSSECDFTNYSRKTVTGTTWAADDTNNRVEETFSTLTYGAAGGSTNNNIGGALLYQFVTADSDSIPLAFWNLGTITTSGITVTIASGSEGAIQGTYA